LAVAADTGRTKSGLWYSVQGNGPTVMFLHGSNLDGRAWGPLPTAASSSYRVILPDLRSHGRSADATGPFSFAEDAIEVLDAVGGDRAILVGHSLGAQVALDVALGHPQRIRALILIGPAIGGMPLTRPPVGFEAMMAALKQGNLLEAGVILAGMPVMTLYQDTTAQPTVRTIVTENVRLFRASPTWLRSLDPPAVGRLGELKIPVLVLRGDRDPTESNEAGRVLVEQVAGAKAERFHGCGHLVPLDCGPAAARALEAFLRQIR
jgi:pimeloyl-ACP methyl ester carboxylesterase